MKVKDPETDVYKGLRTMWEADVDWSEYFQPSNRIWYDLLDGEQFDERHTAADADFPQFKM